MRSHHLPPYSILCACPQDRHPNGIFSRDFQVDSQVGGLPSGSSKIRTLWVDLRLRWGLKQSCNPCWELSNDMLHVTCMQGNRGDSRLLVVESEIVNLALGPSFDHNLCFKCPNGSCKPILDIYVPKAFQWYEGLHNPMNFDPFNYSLKIQESIGTPTPKVGSSLGSVEVQFSHSPILSTSQEHEMWLPGFTLGSQLCKPLPWLWAQG
jgi:hypothetical protein